MRIGNRICAWVGPGGWRGRSDEFDTLPFWIAAMDDTCVKGIQRQSHMVAVDGLTSATLNIVAFMSSNFVLMVISMTLAFKP